MGIRLLTSPGGLKLGVALLLSGMLLCPGCVDGDAPSSDPLPLSRLRVDRTYLRDGHGRYTFFHGVNLSGSTKVPVDKGSGVYTYIGKPFALAEAVKRFAEIHAMGFNVVRLLVIWEGVEPDKKGQYDTAYLAYIREVVKAAGAQGIYVLMDFHQDIFSRHLKVNFNDEPQAGTPGSMEWNLLSLVRRYTSYYEAVQGDGAPKWAVQACLPEKKMDAKTWGWPRILGGLGSDVAKINDLYQLIAKLIGLDTTGPVPDWVGYLITGLGSKYDVDETTDMLPFTNWGLGHLFSLDVARSYACLLAGLEGKPNAAFPKLKAGNQYIHDYLQEAYAGAWAQVAAQVKDLPNVIGYDLMNEPGANFVVLSAVAGMIKYGVAAGAKTALVSLLGQADGEDLYDALVDLHVLPPDTQAATLKKWGLSEVDVMGVLGLNNGFDESYLRPFYERVGKAILAVDPRALIFIEGSLNISMITGGMGGLGGFWEAPMRHPQAPELAGRVVFAPHWYPDIYPFLGFNVEPRTFTVEQVRYRNYQPKLEEARALAQYSLGNIPVVFGEFGTYYNYNNKFSATGALDNQSKKQGYAVSAHILDNYYEAFERMFQSNMLWCYSPENDEKKGDLWNREDFSMLGPDQKPRAELAWSRPHARALAGKPLETHFYSDYHYFDPDKGVVDPRREFFVAYASKETSSPSEVFIPAVQYPQGFYVWVSDGTCHFDPATRVLFHFPTKDEPGTTHWVRVRPPLPQQSAAGWSYFVAADGQVVNGR